MGGPVRAGVLCQRFPVQRQMPVGQLLAELDTAPPGGALRVGDERVLDFLADLSGRLSRPQVARRHPELVPVGYFLRRANLHRMLARIADPPGQVSVPRGAVLHIPPANVPALLVYPWALAALAGCPNVIRLPSADSPARDALLEHLSAAATQASAAVTATQRIVSYGHDDTLTAALSAACRVRLLWGGDQTVAALRRIPIPLGAADLVFPDRASLAVIGAAGWLAASPQRRADLVAQLYTDAYWYGQAACASPLTLVVVGEAGPAELACRELVELLAATVGERQPTVDPQMAVEQRVRTYGLAVEGTAVALRYPGAGLATVELAPGRLLDHWAGTGTFGLLRLRRLTDLVPMLDRRHQTLSHFGLRPAELAGLVDRLGGRALDRVVPIGEALTFEPIWDGYDLLREFTRPVVLRTGPAPEH